VDFVEGLRKPAKGNRWQPQDPESRELDPDFHAGSYLAYVMDETERVVVVPGYGHVHPCVLGNGRPAYYAGEVRLDGAGTVVELNNHSGTFRFRSAEGLKCVAALLT